MTPALVYVDEYEIPKVKPPGVNFLYAFVGSTWVMHWHPKGAEFENVFSHQRIVMNEWDYFKHHGEELELIGWVDPRTYTVFMASHREHFAPDPPRVDMSVWGECFDGMAE